MRTQNENIVAAASEEYEGEMVVRWRKKNGERRKKMEKDDAEILMEKKNLSQVIHQDEPRTMLARRKWCGLQENVAQRKQGWFYTRGERKEGEGEGEGGLITPLVPRFYR